MKPTLSPAPETIVRFREQADIAGCLKLLRAVHDLDGYPAVWPDDSAAFLHPAGLRRAWIALDGRAIVGHIALGAPDAVTDAHAVAERDSQAVDKAEVKRLFVGEAARGKAVAAVLLDTATRYARAVGLLPILEVTTDGLTAIRLYERLGWRRTGTKVASWSDASGQHPLLYTYERPA